MSRETAKSKARKTGEMNSQKEQQKTENLTFGELVALARKNIIDTYGE